MSLALALFFTALLSAESLWMFALSAHIARFMELAAPVFWVASLCGVWATYFRNRSAPRRLAALRTLGVGVGVFALGAVIGAIAIASA